VNYYNFLFLQFGSSFFATPKNKNKKKLAIKQKKRGKKMDIKELLGKYKLKIEVLDFNNNFNIEKTVIDLKKIFNQESIAVQIENITSELL
jgi:3-methyladenine DNA glycosylase AlkC